MIEYKNILFCTDFSEDAQIAFMHAFDLARKHKAKLHILHVAHSAYRYSRHIVDEYVAVNRVHADTKTNTQRARHYREAISVVRRHHGSVPLKWWLAQPYAVWFKSIRPF